MIKNLRKSSITYTPFKAFKEWKFDSVNSSSAIPFVPKEGLRIDGIFYPSESIYYNPLTEPVNSDGSYKRVVYNTVDLAFYRNDSDPLKCFGVENFVHENSDINGRIAVVQIPKDQWGEKIVPKSVTITDYSNPDEIFVMKDDGNTNLYLQNKTFASYDLVYPKGFPYEAIYTHDDPNVYYNIVNGLRSYMPRSSAIELWKNGLGPVFIDQSKIQRNFTYLTHSYEPQNERFGTSVATYNDFILVGSPSDDDTFSNNKSGRAFIYKIDPSTGRHDVIRNLFFDGSQASIINDNSNRHLISTELGDFILYENGNLCPSGSTFVIKDGFGKSTAMTDNFAAIGAPYVELCRDDCVPSGSGLVFCYQGDKGGPNNWGLINVLQGEHSTDEFGYSVSLKGSTLVVGAPGYNSGSGAVYIFKLKRYMSGQCDSVPTSSLGSGSIITLDDGEFIVTSGSNQFLSALFYRGLWQPTTIKCVDNENVFPESEAVPEYIVGDYTWRLQQKIIGSSGSRFGGDVSISDELLVVGNNSLTVSPKHAWVYSTTLSGSICPVQVWDLETTLSSSGVVTNILPNGLDGNNEADNFFGYSVATNGRYIAIGAPRDTLTDYYIGAVYMYEYAKSIQCQNVLDKEVSFLERIYANSITLEANDFGTSVSMNHNRLVVGAPIDFTRKINVSYGQSSHAIETEDEFLVETEDEFLLNGVGVGGKKFIVENFDVAYGRYDQRSVDGNSYIYQLSDIDLEKKINWTKREFYPNKRYGYDVSIGNTLICIGSPLYSQQSGSSASLFVDEMFTDEPNNWENLASIEMRGNVFSYKIAELEDSSAVGNVFYKNGTIILTHTGSQFRNVFFTSGSESGYTLEYKGQQTINEQEIIVSINPGEFNVSTNPTGLINDIPFDVNRDGLFDVNDLAVVLKYISGEPIVDLSKLGDSIGTEQNYKWWNNGPILTESEDLLLASSIFDNISTLGFLTQERYDYITVNLANTGLLNIDGNSDEINPLPKGIIDPKDAIILFRYFNNTLTPEILRDLVDDSSTRLYMRDIFAYLDRMTGKSSGGLLTKTQATTLKNRSGAIVPPMYGTNNGSLIDPNFMNFTESSSLNRTGSYLSPYITTIGLYNGGTLVAVAKMGKPIKNLIDYPMNIAVRFDFG